MKYRVHEIVSNMTSVGYDVTGTEYTGESIWIEDGASDRAIVAQLKRGQHLSSSDVENYDFGYVTGVIEIRDSWTKEPLLMLDQVEDVI